MRREVGKSENDDADRVLLSSLLGREREITAEIDKRGAARTRLRRRIEELRKKILGQLALFAPDLAPAGVATRKKASTKRRKGAP